MSGPERVVVDIAGAAMGGAARWAGELSGFLAGLPVPAPVTVVGRHHQLTAGWLARRERYAAGARIAVAANNVSFAFGGGERRVVLGNALHFLHPSEKHLLAGLPRAIRLQIPVVRGLLARADAIVVPTSAMAGRVTAAVPAARHRLVVRAHPVTPQLPRGVPEPFLLVPVLPAPYKNLVPQLSALLAALDRAGLALAVRVTAGPTELPPALRRHPRLVLLGRVPHATLAPLWQRATAAFFPGTLESFGYPLAEARVFGVPVLAPDSRQAREVAGPALLPYRSGDLASLTAALGRLADPVPAEPDAYHRDAYFRWLFGLPAGPALTAGSLTAGPVTAGPLTARESRGIAS